MEIEMLDEVLEALLLVSGNGLSITEVCDLLELQKSEVDASVKRLKKKYGGKCGIHLISYNGKIQFASNADYADVVASVLNPLREKELSNAALETVAIVAYKQPVTRLEVEQIRGVNCDYALQVLLKHNLIEVVGRKDVVGKPLLFGTTETFLKRFQIEDITQLPDYERLIESIRVIEEGSSTPREASLYNEFEIPDEEVAATTLNEEIVLPDEEEIPEFLSGEQVEKID